MRVAAVDIGTNTVRLLIADVGREIRTLERTSIVTRLGQGVDAAGLLHPDATARVLRVLGDYRLRIAEHDVLRSGAIATSAVRDASNRTAFLAAASDTLGAPVKVIDGEAEARLSFAGATAGLAHPGPYTLVDLGGGSTEIVYGDSGPETASSIDMGSVRLTERCLGPGPIGATELAGARQEALRALASCPRQAARTTIGVGGTFTSLAALNLELPRYDPDAVHMSALGVDRFTALVESLAAMSTDEIAALPSMDPARAPVMLGGAIVAEQAVHHLGVPALFVSENDILDGYAAELATG